MNSLCPTILSLLLLVPTAIIAAEQPAPGATPVDTLGECNRDGLAKRAIRALAPMELMEFRAPPTTQATAPAAAATTTNVDSPERPRWLALAVEQGFATETDSGGVTVSLAPVEWLENLQPSGYFDSNATFKRTNYLRTLTGSLTMGNKGVSLGSDQGGMALPPAEAKSLQDSVLVELQYRFWGTRDRREATSDDRFRSRYGAQLEAYESAIAQANDLYTAFLADPRFDALLEAHHKGGVLSSEECTVQLQRLLEGMADEPGMVASAKAYLQSDQALVQIMNELAFELDNAWVWSVSVSALDREDYLGPDRLAMALRGLKGFASQGLDAMGGSLLFNLEYSEQESLAAAQSDMRGATLRVEYVGAFAEGRFGRFEKSRWAFSLAGEKNWDAPVAARKSQLVAGFRLEVPVAENISIPFSLKWSNRDELLQDEDEIVGHIGVSIDFDAFLGSR